jgi:hypothetical protein
MVKEYTCRGVHALLTYPDFVVKHYASNNYPSRVLANCCHHKLKLKALVSGHFTPQTFKEEKVQLTDPNIVTLRLTRESSKCAEEAQGY